MEAGHRAIKGPSIDSTWCSLGTRFFVSSILEEVDEAIDERRDAAKTRLSRITTPYSLLYHNIITLMFLWGSRGNKKSRGHGRRSGIINWALRHENKAAALSFYKCCILAD